MDIGSAVTDGEYVAWQTQFEDHVLDNIDGPTPRLNKTAFSFVYNTYASAPGYRCGCIQVRHESYLTEVINEINNFPVKIGDKVIRFRGHRDEEFEWIHIQSELTSLLPFQEGGLERYLEKNFRLESNGTIPRDWWRIRKEPVCPPGNLKYIIDIDIKKPFWLRIRSNDYNLPIVVSKVKAWEPGKRYMAIKTVEERNCDRIQQEKEKTMAEAIRRSLKDQEKTNIFSKKSDQDIDNEVKQRIAQEHANYELSKRKAIESARQARRHTNPPPASHGSLRGINPVGNRMVRPPLLPGMFRGPPVGGYKSSKPSNSGATGPHPSTKEKSSTSPKNHPPATSASQAAGSSQGTGEATASSTSTGRDPAPSTFGRGYWVNPFEEGTPEWLMAQKTHDKTIKRRNRKYQNRKTNPDLAKVQSQLMGLPEPASTSRVRPRLRQDVGGRPPRPPQRPDQRRDHYSRNRRAYHAPEDADQIY